MSPGIAGQRRRGKVSVDSSSTVTLESLARIAGKRGEGVLIWSNDLVLLLANADAADLLDVDVETLAPGLTLDSLRQRHSSGVVHSLSEHAPFLEPQRDRTKSFSKHRSQSVACAEPASLHRPCRWFQRHYP